MANSDQEPISLCYKGWIRNTDGERKVWEGVIEFIPSESHKEASKIQILIDVILFTLLTTP